MPKNIEQIKKIADDMHHAIADIVSNALEEHASHEVLPAFLAAMPTLLGKAFVVFEEGENRKAAMHDFVFAVVESVDAAGKQFNEYKKQQGV